MLHISQGLPNQTVMGASGAYARKTHTTMRHRKQQTHLMQNIKSANMFQTHTSGQFFTLLVNPSHFWSITSGRCFPCHACNFWSMLHISNQSVTLLPVTSGQSLTLPEGQFCTGQSGSRCNQRARQCIGAAKGRTASIWSPQCMKGSSPALKKGEQILP